MRKGSKEDEEKRLVYYVGVASISASSEMLPTLRADYPPGSGNARNVAMEALMEFRNDGMNCRTYTMSFDDTMVAFMRHSEQSDLIFMMSCHCSLTKKDTWDILATVQKSFPSNFEQEVRSIIQKSKRKVPRRVDLVMYANAPHAYKVHHEGDEAPKDYVQPTAAPKNPGWKSLQEELEELSDDEELSSSSSRPSRGDTNHSAPLGSSSAVPRNNGGQGFPFRPAPPAKEARPMMSGSQLRVAPILAPPPSKTWSVNFSSRQGGWGATQPPSQEVELRRGGASGDFSKKRSSDDMAPHGDSPSSDDGSQPDKFEDSKPLRGKKPFVSDEYPKQSSESEKRRTSSSPFDFLGALPRSNSYKSQEHRRVSPEEALQESRTDIFGKKTGFQPERVRPPAGRIGDMAPSGLSWEEEIRRHHVARGMPPPQVYSGRFSAASDSPDSAARARADKQNKAGANVSAAGLSLKRQTLGEEQDRAGASEPPSRPGEEAQADGAHAAGSAGAKTHNSDQRSKWSWALQHIRWPTFWSGVQQQRTQRSSWRPRK
eukprot:TRINITY_DN570_c0_g1_i1.p1 TRINITY_DN570_c0_g1~~TRINITY_DN570_c0_g1_i1.p1  ORF type:complete len:543 (-),score=81.58 TRINITY_DN570_c0_g1_i1:1780-3408(-)